MSTTIKKLFVVILSLYLFINICEAKNMYPVNISRGETPNDVGAGCEVTLSDENCGEGAEFSLRIVFTEGTWVGEYNPKKAFWTGYKSMNFSAFNSLNRKVTMAVGIMDEVSFNNNGGRKSLIVMPFELKSGMNNVRLSLEDVKSQDGRISDMKKIKKWYISYKYFPENKWEEKGSGEFTVFISNLRLEN